MEDAELVIQMPVGLPCLKRGRRNKKKNFATDSIYDCYFIIFFKLLTISGQKRQICERILNFLPILCGLNEFASFCVGFPQEKLQVLTNHKKVKIWGS